MALYDRLLGVDPLPKIPIHSFQAIIAEWARGNFTLQQARDAITFVSGTALTAAEETEAQTLVGTVTSIPITGSATQIADGRARRALRMQEIDQVLLLVDQQCPPYTTAAAVKTRLGV